MNTKSEIKQTVKELLVQREQWKEKEKEKEIVKKKQDELRGAFGEELWERLVEAEKNFPEDVSLRDGKRIVTPIGYRIGYTDGELKCMEVELDKDTAPVSYRVCWRQDRYTSRYVYFSVKAEDLQSFMDSLTDIFLSFILLPDKSMEECKDENEIMERYAYDIEYF